MKKYRVDYGNDGSGITYKVIVDGEPEKNRFFYYHEQQGKWKKREDGTPYFKPGRKYDAKKLFSEYTKKLAEEGYEEEVPQIIKDFRVARENGGKIEDLLQAFPMRKVP